MNGIEEDDYGSLWNMIEIVREDKVEEYKNAPDDELKATALENLKKCDADIERIHHCLCLIDDEIVKGEDSVLRVVDRAAEIPRITIISLKEWKKANDFTNPGEETEDMIKTAKKIVSPTKHNNMMAKFGVLIEDYADLKGDDKRYKYGNKPNSKNIAEDLVRIAKERNPPADIGEAGTVAKSMSHALNAIDKV